MATQLCQALHKVLRSVKRPGDFCTSGRMAVRLPALEVEGVGRIALPLLETQARQLIEAAEAAPYGRGSETLHDPDYRRTWQIDAGRIRLRGAAWEKDLEAIVRRAAEGLGVEGPVDAQLYKLLIYEPGCFFLPHRDTEKAAGMFATLVVVLPSDFAGGELVVGHQGRQVTLDLHQDDPAEVSYAAFYADCRHEVKPVRAGYRLALIFNLVRPQAKRLPEPPTHEPAIARLAETLRGWGDDDPGWLIYPLEHAYSEAELDFATLKGRDRAVAEVLAAAAERAGCELYLSLFSIEESGWAECVGWNDFEIGEVADSLAELHTWRSPDGCRLDFGRLPFDEENLCPPQAWNRIEAQEPEFMEATGNEGASFERFYRGAALVLWPCGRTPEVLAGAPLDFALAYLETRLRDWSDAGRPGSERPALASLFTAVIDSWPQSPSHRQDASPVARMAELLTPLADAAVIARFLARVSECGFLTADVAALAALLSQCPATDQPALLAQLVRGNIARHPDASARLLRHCLEQGKLPATAWRPAAEALIAALPADTDEAESAAPYPPRWLAALSRERGPEPEPLIALVTDLLPALDAIAADLGQAALAHFQANPKIYDLDKVLRPAALRLASDPKVERTGAVAALCDRVAESLRRRTEEPPAKPADWRRPARLSCNCPHCRELARFLDDPDRAQWELKAVKAERTHVEEVIRRANCDLDCQTIRRGSPHTLRCVKNDASYRRALQDYERMCADLERLAQAR